MKTLFLSLESSFDRNVTLSCVVTKIDYHITFFNSIQALVYVQRSIVLSQPCLRYFIMGNFSKLVVNVPVFWP